MKDNGPELRNTIVSKLRWLHQICKTKCCPPLRPDFLIIGLQAEFFFFFENEWCPPEHREGKDPRQLWRRNGKCQATWTSGRFVWHLWGKWKEWMKRKKNPNRGQMKQLMSVWVRVCGEGLGVKFWQKRVLFLARTFNSFSPGCLCHSGSSSSSSVIVFPLLLFRPVTPSPCSCVGGRWQNCLLSPFELFLLWSEAINVILWQG